jgi:hypothetical protein
MDYNERNDSRDLKSILSELTERVSNIENNMPKYYDNHDHGYRSRNIYIPRKYENHSVDSVNSDNNYLLNTINNMLVRMNELDQSNKNKENRINELEHLINKGNGNNNYTMAKKPRGLIEDVQMSSDSKRDKKNNNKLKSKKPPKRKNRYGSSDSSSIKEKDRKKNRNRNKSNDDSRKHEEEKNHESENEDLGKKNSKPSRQASILNSKDFNADQFKAQTNLEIVGREDLRNYINSRIFFTKKELVMVKKKILKDQTKKVVLFDLLYRATIDGDYEDAIIANCEGSYPQLILFYTLQGARFGIYIEKEEHVNLFGNVSYKEVPGTSFLISLNSLKTYDILKGKKATHDRDEKLCFGRSFMFNDNGSNWLIYTPRNEFLDAQCMIGNQESDFGKIDTNEIVGINKTYQLKEVEIFKVIIEPIEAFSTDEENNKNQKQ